jgi:hypothetical protein
VRALLAIQHGPGLRPTPLRQGITGTRSTGKEKPGDESLPQLLRTGDKPRQGADVIKCSPICYLQGSDRIIGSLLNIMFATRFSRIWVRFVNPDPGPGAGIVAFPPPQ